MTFNTKDAVNPDSQDVFGREPVSEAHHSRAVIHHLGNRRNPLGRGDGQSARDSGHLEASAESVRKFLAAQGATLRMATRGWGEKKPVAPNAKPDGKDDPEGRQKNRRVEITVENL